MTFKPGDIVRCVSVPMPLGTLRPIKVGGLYVVMPLDMLNKVNENFVTIKDCGNYFERRFELVEDPTPLLRLFLKGVSSEIK